ARCERRHPHAAQGDEHDPVVGLTRALPQAEMRRAAEEDEIGHGQLGLPLGLLHDDGEPGRALVLPQLRELAPIDADRPLGSDRAVQGPEERGLPGAVGPHQAEHAALGCAQIDAAEHGLRPECPADALRLDHSPSLARICSSPSIVRGVAGSTKLNSSVMTSSSRRARSPPAPGSRVTASMTASALPSPSSSGLGSLCSRTRASGSRVISSSAETSKTRPETSENTLQDPAASSCAVAMLPVP